MTPSELRIKDGEDESTQTLEDVRRALCQIHIEPGTELSSCF